MQSCGCSSTLRECGGCLAEGVMMVREQQDHVFGVPASDCWVCRWKDMLVAVYVLGLVVGVFLLLHTLGCYPRQWSSHHSLSLEPRESIVATASLKRIKPSV